MVKNGIYAESGLPEALTAEETKKCFWLARNGDDQAKNKLIEHNLRLVVHIINKQFENVVESDSSIDEDDLISIGSIGLIKAVETFDINKNIKFSTYSAKCIKNEILMFLRKGEKRSISLDANIHADDGDELSLLEMLASNDDIQEEYVQAEERKEVTAALETLSDFERTIIELRYGFNGYGLNLTQTADQLGWSRSYVSKVARRAIQKLKKAFENSDDKARQKNVKLSLKKRINY